VLTSFVAFALAAAGAFQLLGLCLALGLLLLSAIFRGVSTLQIKYTMQASLYYPLIVLPELLSTIYLSAPILAVQTGLAGRMGEWEACGRKPLTGPGLRQAEGGGVSHSTADAAVTDGLATV
jgi:hypothetical protein